MNLHGLQGFQFVQHLHRFPGRPASEKAPRKERAENLHRFFHGIFSVFIFYKKTVPPSVKQEQVFTCSLNGRTQNSEMLTLYMS